MTIDHLLHGWEMKENGILMTLRTHDNIALEGLVELVSCSCNDDCSEGRCTCKTNNVPCTGLYGWGDECQNTGTSPLPSAFNDNDDGNEQLGQPDWCTEGEIKKLEESIQKIEKLEDLDSAPNITY